MTATIDYRIRGIAFPVRCGLFALVFSAAVFLQLTVSVPLGLVFAFLSTVPFMARGYSNEPNDLGLEEWKPVGMREIDRVADNLRGARSIKVPWQYRAPPKVLLAVAAFAAALVLMIADSWDALFLLANLAIACFPFLFYGGVRVWIPRELQMKMDCVQAVLAEPMAPGLSVTPYLRFDKDKEGRMIPEDARLMVEPRRKPADFRGVQLQASINDGENGKVPYMYAVFLTNGKGASWETLSRMNVEGYEVEAGGDGDYGTVVVRQATGGGGYHTKADDCARLFRVCGNALAYLEKQA